MSTTSKEKLEILYKTARLHKLPFMPRIIASRQARMKELELLSKHADENRKSIYREEYKWLRDSIQALT